MHENLITSFVEITSSSREEATFFLQSHRWDLDAAVSTFLDNDAADLPTGPNLNLPPPSSIPAASPSQSHSPDYSPSETSPSPPSRDAPYRLRSKGAASENQGADNPSGSRNTRSRQHAGNIRTFVDLNRSQANGADCDSDDGQEYYTGRQKSGMMVQDPKEAKDVDALFEQARQSAIDRPDEPSRSASTSLTGASRLFSGVHVPSAPQQQQQDQPQVVMHGPLRSFGDPENATFLESIALTECQRELEPVDRKVRAHVDLVRREDNYTEPQASPAQMNTTPALARWEAIRALRQLNLSPERPDSWFLKTLDTNSKKTTKLLKHLKGMDEEELLETIDDLRGVKVRASEAVYAICQATILSSNVQAAAQICSLLHQRHKEFSPCLKQSLLKVFSPRNSDWMKKSSNLLLLLLLYYVGVIEDCHIFVNVIEDLTSVEQLRDRAMIPHNVAMLVDFAEHERVFLGLPFSREYEDGLDVTAELENSCKMAFNTYYAALADPLGLLDQMDKENAKMELSGDNASSHEKLKKSCYDLYCYLSTLAESLDMQPPAKDGTITESVDMQPSAKDFTTWLAKVWPNHLIPIDLRPSVQADLSGEAASTSDKQSAKEKENTSEAYTVPLPLDVMTKILSMCEVEDLVRFRTVNKEISVYNYELLKHQALEFFIRVDNNHTVQ